MENNNRKNTSQQSTWKKFKLDFMRRVKENRRSRWIRFAIVSIIFFAWVVWLGNPLVALWWLLLFDVYITGYIPFTWWKRSKSSAVRTVMGWVDAILYAVILVYFIFAYVGQNYKIPSSSLEKTLLVGDYLWVNKMVYGPRVPQTPLHFPLAQHTLPILNCKSYLESPQFEYHRLPGIRNVGRFDIVVFNFPGEDFRPVDRRENYVKRCIGLPGEKIKITNDTIFINGKALPEPKHVQYCYDVPFPNNISTQQWQEIGMRQQDLHNVYTTFADYFSGQTFKVLPLTYDAVKKVEGWLGHPILRNESLISSTESYFPIAIYGWDISNLGELWIPRQGSTLKLTLGNLPIYRRLIEVYEGNSVEVRDNQIFINGNATDQYTFSMDYYWMQGDNRDMSADSRFWGFVPEDHIVGTPMFVICSFDEDRSLFDGKIRWSRSLSDANPDD